MLSSFVFAFFFSFPHFVITVLRNSKSTCCWGYIRVQQVSQHLRLEPWTCFEPSRPSPHSLAHSLISQKFTRVNTSRALRLQQGSCCRWIYLERDAQDHACAHLRLESGAAPCGTTSEFASPLACRAVAPFDPGDITSGGWRSRRGLVQSRTVPPTSLFFW